MQASTPQKDIWSLRLQPSAGIGYVPSGKQDVEIQSSGTASNYIYNAGNIKTEFITGLGFEFMKNKKRFLTLNINYFKGWENNETVLTTESDGKPLNTNINSKLSGWNASVGIPISFAKKSSTTKTQTKTHHSCSEYYRSRCGSYRKI
jgi:TPP-dependent trihydroxycyclohexane-1,2-dione (THcHDO) dehydratase